MKRSDLMDLGELLDNGTSDLVVVAATDLDRRSRLPSLGQRSAPKVQRQADTDALKKDIDNMRAA